MSNTRLVKNMAKTVVDSTKNSYFPALIETEGTLKIVNHDEIPIGVNFTVLAVAPLTPEIVLQVCLKWIDKELDKLVREVA